MADVSYLISLGLGSPASIGHLLRFGLGAGAAAPAAETLQWMLEMELSGPGNGWTDVSSHLRLQHMLHASYGIDGHDLNDRVGSAGDLRFDLDNGIVNPVGYYSLYHANRRAGFDYDIGVRWHLSFQGYQRYKFLGKLADIDVAPGVHETRLTQCRALDWMDDAAATDMPDLEAQQNLRPDQLITLVLDAMTTPPAARSLDVGSESYGWAMDGAALQERVKVREILAQIASSESGRIYLRGNATTGGELRFEARAAALISPVVFAFDDSMLLRDGGLDTTASRDDLIGSVQVTVHPIRVDDTSDTVLYNLQTTHTLVRAGQTLNTLFGPYRDPTVTGGALIGGTAFITPVATTDYTMNSAQDESGTDLTADFLVTASTTGRGVRWTIVNTGGTDGYITSLQLRGKGIYRTDTVIDQPVTGGGSRGRVMALDMPLQNSVNVASSVATYLSYTLGSARARVNRIRFLANESDALMVQAIIREPGDRITVQETVTGMSATAVINRVSYDLQDGRFLWCTFDLAPAAAAQQYWLLGVVGFSELGVTTRLGI